MPHLITSMDDLTLNPAHNSNICRVSSNDPLQEVHTHTSPMYVLFNEFLGTSSSSSSRCLCFLFQTELTETGPGLTQGDKLRALKSRRPPRPATTGALRYHSQRQNPNLTRSGLYLCVYLTLLLVCSAATVRRFHLCTLRAADCVQSFIFFVGQTCSSGRRCPAAKTLQMSSSV